MSTFSSECTGEYQEFDVIAYKALPFLPTDTTYCGRSLDMVLLYLGTPLDSNGNRTAVPMIDPISVELNTPTSGENIVIAGWGKNGTCPDQGTYGLRYGFGRWFDEVPDGAACAISDIFNNCYQVSGSPCSTQRLTCDWGTQWLPASTVYANMHDSGGAVLVSRTCSNPTRSELRIIGVITTPGGAAGVRAWDQIHSLLGSPSGIPTLASIGSQCVAPCAADFNYDGVVDCADLSGFTTAYFAGRCIADFDEDGSLQPSDFSAFATAYSACGGPTCD